MKKECTAEEAYAKAEAYCAMAEHCESEVRAKLKQWGAPSDCWDETISRLRADNYMSSSRYIGSFVREKWHFNKWGKQKISQALKMKGLPESLVDEAIEEMDKEEYLSVLLALLRKKRKEVKADSDYERNGKLIRFALSRGYGMEDILFCLKENGCSDEYME